MNGRPAVPLLSAEPIRILQLEDDPADADIEFAQLRREGLVFVGRRVETRPAFLAALETFKPHLIIADNKLPAFDGKTAISLAQELHPEIPVILVSGTVGDEGAVDMIRRGARDFVLKDRMGRLGAAVRAALADANDRRLRAEAQWALEESELRFRNLTEHTSDIIAVARFDGTITYISPAVRVLGGYEPAEVVGRSYFDFVYPDDVAEARAHLAELAARPHETVRYELRFRHRDGTARVMESVARNLANIPGVEGVVVNMRDITDRRRAEEALRTSESRLREIVENATNLFYSHTVDNVLTYLSPQTRQYLDCDPGEAMVRWTEFLTDYPGNRQGQELTRKAIETGERQPPYELELVGKRGRRVWVLVNESPVVRDGRTVAVVGSLTDITERRGAIEKLRLANLVVEHSPAVLFRWAPQQGWPVTYVTSNVRRWGYEPDALLAGTPPYADLIHRDDLARVSEEVANHVADGATEFAQEYRIVTPSGDVLWVDDRTTVQRDASGAAVAFQGVVTDITARKRAEELERATTARALRGAEALGRAASSPALGAGELEALARLVTELAASVSGAARANAWLFNDDETELRCIDLYDAAAGTHSAGAVLKESQFANEFRALKAEPFVAADDPATDPRTAGYLEGYLRPLGITSMLDAVILQSGRHLGLLCIEHVGQPHHWEPDEIAFACGLADKLALCIANRERAAVTAALRQAQSLARLGSWRLDPATGKVLWSAEIFAVFGLDPREPAPDYRQAPGLMPAESFARVDAAIAECRKSGTPFVMDLEVQQRGGGPRWITVRGEAVRDPDGTITAIHGTAQDITDRHDAEARLRAQLEELERWQGVHLDREQRVLALKREVNELLSQGGRAPRYRSVP